MYMFHVQYNIATVEKVQLLRSPRSDTFMVSAMWQVFVYIQTLNQGHSVATSHSPNGRRSTDLIVYCEIEWMEVVHKALPSHRKTSSSLIYKDYARTTVMELDATCPTSVEINTSRARHTHENMEMIREKKEWKKKIKIFLKRKFVIDKATSGLEPDGYHPSPLTNAALRPATTFSVMRVPTVNGPLPLGQAPRTFPLLTIPHRNHLSNSSHPGRGHIPDKTPRTSCSLTGWPSFSQLTAPSVGPPRTNRFGRCVWYPTPRVHRRSPVLWYVTQGGDRLLMVFQPHLPFILTTLTTLDNSPPPHTRRENRSNKCLVKLN